MMGRLVIAASFASLLIGDADAADEGSKQVAYDRAVRELTKPSDRLSGILRRRNDMEPGKIATLRF